jgi:hypothetical protein
VSLGDGESLGVSLGDGESLGVAEALGLGLWLGRGVWLGHGVPEADGLGLTDTDGVGLQPQSGWPPAKAVPLPIPTVKIAASGSAVTNFAVVFKEILRIFSCPFFPPSGLTNRPA